MPEPLECDVRWTDRTFRARPQPGILRLTDECLTLSSPSGEEVFSLPVSQQSNMEWPRWSFDSAFRVAVNGRNYGVTFIPGSASLGTWHRGMREGTKWKTRLVPGFVPSRALGWALELFVFLMVLAGVTCGLLLGFILAVDPDAKWYQRLFGCLAMLYAVGNGAIWIQERRRAKRSA